MKTNAQKLKFLADTVVLASEDLTKGRVQMAHALLQKGLDAVGKIETSANTHDEFERAMIASNYPVLMFQGFAAEGEKTYYDARANLMFDAWQAALAR